MNIEETIRKQYQDTYRARRRNIYFKDGQLWLRVDKLSEDTETTYNRIVEAAVRAYLQLPEVRQKLYLGK